jgi:formylmethanofuran dehydrogenase subunit E
LVCKGGSFLAIILAVSTNSPRPLLLSVPSELSLFLLSFHPSNAAVLGYLIADILSPSAIEPAEHQTHGNTDKTMKTLPEYLELATVVHGHICAGQVLGVRLAMLGLKELGIDDPIADRKRIMTYVEIDRCVTDAVALVANCRLGKRALKFRDWGKVAATFCDLQTGRAVRIAAKESSKQAAKEMFPELPKEQGQQKAYAQLPDDVLFSKEWVKVEVQPEDLPGFKGPRIVCAECGEGINFKREVVENGRTLCRACAGEKYYKPL